jgi:hypothetical protein
MAIVSVPTGRVALSFHLAGGGAVLSGSTSPYAFFLVPLAAEWPGITTQYIPDPLVSPNDVRVDVDGFGNSLFFNFPTGSNLGGGIQAFMANLESSNYGEAKVDASRIDNAYMSIYVSNCGTFNPRSLAGTANNPSGRRGSGGFDIWWDFENNYPGGFELTVNSKVFGGRIGHYRGITDQCGVAPSILNCRINGNGPDGTPSTTYFDDGGSATDRVVTIPWKDILAVEAIFVHFVEGDPI